MKKPQPVEIMGQYYDSMCLAEKTIGCGKGTVRNRINTPNKYLSYIKVEYRSPKEKQCSKCKTVKLLDKFKITKANKDNRSSWCKKCHSNEVTKNVNKAKAKINHKRFRSTEKGREAMRYWRTIGRMKRKKADVVLMKEEQQQISDIYKEARKLRKQGINVEIDHKIAIKNGGKHHPDNLQILLIEDHRAKTHNELLSWGW